MTFELYADLNSLDLRFVHFFIGSLKRFLLRHFYFVRRPRVRHPESDESDESDEEKSDKLGSESGRAGMFGTKLGRLLRGIGFFVGGSFQIWVNANDTLMRHLLIPKIFNKKRVYLFVERVFG